MKHRSRLSIFCAVLALLAGCGDPIQEGGVGLGPERCRSDEDCAVRFPEGGVCLTADDPSALGVCVSSQGPVPCQPRHDCVTDADCANGQACRELLNACGLGTICGYLPD